MFFITALAHIQLINLFLAEIALSNTKANLISHFHPNVEQKRISFNEQVSIQLQVLNRAQQAYFFETGKFASEDHQLGLGTIQDNDNYQLIIKSNDNLTVTYAIPYQSYGTYKEWSGSSWVDSSEPLYSYVSGTAFFADKNTFQSILCVSKTADKTKLAPPIIINNELVCSLNTEEIP